MPTLFGWRPLTLPRGTVFAMQCCASKGCRVSKRGQGRNGVLPGMAYSYSVGERQPVENWTFPPQHPSDSPASSYTWSLDPHRAPIGTVLSFVPLSQATEQGDMKWLPKATQPGNWNQNVNPSPKKGSLCDPFDHRLIIGDFHLLLTGLIHCFKPGIDQHIKTIEGK